MDQLARGLTECQDHCWAIVSSLNKGGYTFKTFYIWGWDPPILIIWTEIKNTLDFWTSGRGKSLGNQMDAPKSMNYKSYEVI